MGNSRVPVAETSLRGFEAHRLLYEDRWYACDCEGVGAEIYLSYFGLRLCR